MYMDDIKLFVENEKELETLVQAVRIYNQGIGIEFGIERCAMLIIRRGKRDMTARIEPPDQEKIRMFGKKRNLQIL